MDIRVDEQRKYHRRSLAAGSMDAFLPACELDESSGFPYCPPLGDDAADSGGVILRWVLPA